MNESVEKRMSVTHQSENTETVTIEDDCSDEDVCVLL